MTLRFKIALLASLICIMLLGGILTYEYRELMRAIRSIPEGIEEIAARSRMPVDGSSVVRLNGRDIARLDAQRQFSLGQPAQRIVFFEGRWIDRIPDNADLIAILLSDDGTPPKVVLELVSGNREHGPPIGQVVLGENTFPLYRGN